MGSSIHLVEKLSVLVLKGCELPQSQEKCVSIVQNEIKKGEYVNVIILNDQTSSPNR